MAEEEVVTREPARTTVVRRPAGFYSFANLVYLLFGILEALLLFRFVFKLLGANPTSAFVDFIYGVTAPFVSPFEGIFGKTTTSGATTTAVFDPATLIAILVYALVAWVLVRVVAAATNHPVA